MITDIVKDINSKKDVLILGYGREGKATYNLIRKYLKDKKLTIADSNIKLLEINPELKQDENLDFILGENYLDNLNRYDMIIKSPGVNFKYINYSEIENKITSQIDLFLKHTKAKTIGVTGTKGKSTTSSLIYHVLKSMKIDAVLAGNIGIPIFEELDKINEDTIVILELSCHQLQFVNYAPNISVLLNLYEEHLDLYKSYHEYQKAKLNIFSKQKDNDYKVWNLDNVDLKKWYYESNNTYVYSSDKLNIKNGILINEDGLYLVKNKEEKLVYDKTRKRNLLGNHNLYNIAASLCVCDILGLDIDVVSKHVDSFKSLEHRMELVGTYNGITFYNDSIATIPNATISCIKSINNLSTVIIGGMNRELNLDELINYLNETDKIKTCIFLKDTGYMICDKLLSMGCDKNLYKAEDMKDAVKYAYLNTNKGYACALSPAAASYNTYKNFEERGKDFKELVKIFNKKLSEKE